MPGGHPSVSPAGRLIWRNMSNTCACRHNMSASHPMVIGMLWFVLMCPSMLHNNMSRYISGIVANSKADRLGLRWRQQAVLRAIAARFHGPRAVHAVEH